MTNEQRLQQLLEEFEAARHAYAGKYDVDNADVLIANADWQNDLAKQAMERVAASIRQATPEKSASYNGPNEQGREAALLARRYIIARDFNEFRDGHWQTLWKLQNG